MEIFYGNSLDNLRSKEGTKDELAKTLETYPIIFLADAKREIDDNGFFNVPEGVTVIEEQAFCDCSSLITINLPKSLKEIKYRTFENCSSLTTITLPKGITNIESKAFYGCSSLKTIIYDGDESDIGEIKSLFAPRLRDKVISKSRYEAKLFQEEAIIELAQTPQFCVLYKWRTRLKVMLPDSMLAKINSFLSNDKTCHPTFFAGRKKLQSISHGLFLTNKSAYQRELLGIIKQCRIDVGEKMNPNMTLQLNDAKKEEHMQKTKATF